MTSWEGHCITHPIFDAGPRYLVVYFNCGAVTGQQKPVDDYQHQMSCLYNLTVEPNNIITQSSIMFSFVQGSGDLLEVVYVVWVELQCCLEHFQQLLHLPPLPQYQTCCIISAGILRHLACPPLTYRAYSHPPWDSANCSSISFCRQPWVCE